MKIETTPIFELDNFVALRSKSFSFRYGIEKSKQQGIHHTPRSMEYLNSLFNSQRTAATNYSIRSDAHNLIVQTQAKLALNPFDDKRMYLNKFNTKFILG